MERLCFACCVRLNGSDRFVIWYDDERCGFVRDADDHLVVADSLESLVAAASGLGLILAPEPAAVYDFDVIGAWCQNPTAEAVDCPSFSHAWNFFDDFAGYSESRDSPYASLSRSAERTYEKLFWGCNLPSITCPGERFTPTWEADELETIRQAMEAGLALTKADLQS